MKGGLPCVQGFPSHQILKKILYFQKKNLMNKEIVNLNPIICKFDCYANLLEIVDMNISIQKYKIDHISFCNIL